MDTRLLRTFQNQVLLQCQFVLYAAGDLNDALNQGDTRKTFYLIQNLLDATANISKVLWGARGTLAEQREPVRVSIGVTDDSPLRLPAMRNNFEHFDERIDRWWKESKHHGYTDLNIMPRTAVSSLDDIDVFRWFDQQTTDVIFWSEKFNVQEIVNEVQRILPLVTQEASKRPF